MTLTAPAAQAATVDSDAAPTSAHQGLAFAPTIGAKVRVIEPDGRVVKTDGASDLVAPSSITERRVHSAIAELVHTAVPAGRRATAVMAAPALQAP